MTFFVHYTQPSGHNGFRKLLNTIAYNNNNNNNNNKYICEAPSQAQAAVGCGLFTAKTA